MMKISWKDKVNNEKVLRRVGAKRRLAYDLRMRQMSFLGHVMRKQGRRSRGRRRVLVMSSLKEWLEEAGVKEKEAELMQKAFKFKQGIVAGHDRQSQQIQHIEIFIYSIRY